MGNTFRFWVLFLSVFCAFPHKTIAFKPQIDRINLQISSKREIIFAVYGATLPGFQIYSLGDDHRYAIDLPGIRISQLPRPHIPDNLLLHDIVLEQRSGRHIQNPRALFIFNGNVDYDIKGQKDGIIFSFSFQGDLDDLLAQKKKRQQADRQNQQNAQAEKHRLQLEQAKTHKQLIALRKEVALTSTKLIKLQRAYKSQKRNQEQELKTIQSALKKQEKRYAKTSLLTENKKAQLSELGKELEDLRKAHQERHNQTKTQLKIYQNKIIALGHKREQQLAAHQQALEKKEHAQESLAKLKESLIQKENELKNTTSKAEKIAFELRQNVVSEIHRKKELRKEIDQLIHQRKNEEISLLALTRRKRKEQRFLDALEKERKSLEHILLEKEGLEKELRQKQAIQKKLDAQQIKDQQQQQQDNLQQELLLQKRQDLLQKKHQDLEGLRRQKIEILKEIAKQKEKHTTFLKKNKKERNKARQEKDLHITHQKEILSQLRLEKSLLLQDLAQKKKEQISFAEQEEKSRQMQKQIADAQARLDQLHRLSENVETKLQQTKTSHAITKKKTEKEVSELRQHKLKTQAQLEELRQAQDKMQTEITQKKSLLEKHLNKQIRDQEKLFNKQREIIGKEKLLIQALKKEQSTVRAELELQKEENQRLKNQAQKTKNELKNKYLALEQEKQKELSILSKKVLALQSQLTEQNHLQKESKHLVEKQSLLFSDLQVQISTLAKEKKLLQKELASLHQHKSKNVVPASTMDSVPLSTKANPNKAAGAISVSSSTLPALKKMLPLHNRYWQISPEKISASAFGGSRTKLTNEPGRGLLNRLMVVKHDHKGSSVALRIDGGARFAVQKESPTSYILNLFDTRAGNLKVRRILDASDIKSNVLRLLPHIEEGKRNRVSLRIEMRRPTHLQTDQDGSLLWLHFEDQ